MQTHLTQSLLQTAEGREADRILRSCVHCGFCNAVCPTYQLLGDELDGPRGRIYLMKQVMEGAAASATTRLHLDRCLTCRACESVCPSGVEYGKLLDVGRSLVEERAPRTHLFERMQRWALRRILPYAARLRFALWGMRLVHPLIPSALAAKLPCPPAGANVPDEVWPAPRHARRMLVLGGCAQSVLMPRINVAAARVLDRLGISLIEVPSAGCCGALRFHMNDQSGGLRDARRLIDAWWPLIEGNAVEAIVMTASGCGTFVKDYADAFADDPAYDAKAQRIAALTRDIVQILNAEESAVPALARALRLPHNRLALHLPCSLQHAQKLGPTLEELLRRLGCNLSPVADTHLCCGSAGVYSILQPELARTLRDNKIAALETGQPDVIVSANIGCLLHIASGTGLPTMHWIEWLDQYLNAADR